MDKVYSKSLQKVLQTIEEELEFITIEELIHQSGYSYYHFHRIFKAYTGESLKKYIKRLRMEKSLQKIQINKSNITQVAIESGYYMSSSYNKAFKDMFSLSPSEYKNNFEATRINYPDIAPTRIDRIEDKNMYSMRHVGNYSDLDEPIEKFIEFAGKNNLISNNFCLYTIPHDNPNITDDKRLRFDVCIEIIKNIDISHIGWIYKKTISGGKYAVFTHKGDPENLIKLYDAIFGKWLHSSDIVLRDEPIFQKFLNNKYEVTKEELLAEVYVPIV